MRAEIVNEYIYIPKKIILKFVCGSIETIIPIKTNTDPASTNY